LDESGSHPDVVQTGSPSAGTAGTIRNGPYRRDLLVRGFTQKRWHSVPPLMLTTRAVRRVRPPARRCTRRPAAEQLTDAVRSPSGRAGPRGTRSGPADPT